MFSLFHCRGSRSDEEGETEGTLEWRRVRTGNVYTPHIRHIKTCLPLLTYLEEMNWSFLVELLAEIESRMKIFAELYQNLVSILAELAQF